jgi:hypothetical protein
MADPVVHLTNGVPDSGTGNITTLGQTLLDGANITTGATADAAVAAGAAGSLSAKLRSISRDLVANIVLAAGSALIGIVKVGDGTNSAAIKAASTAPLATDPALVVAISPNSVNANGQKTMANSAPVVLASDQASIPVNATGVDQYATHKEVGASATATVLGATGAIGDYLAYVVVYPGTAGCGVVTILDAAATVGTFAGGGTTALPSLAPFTIPVGAFCTGAGWKITTGANVTVSAVGKFT